VDVDNKTVSLLNKNDAVKKTWGAKITGKVLLVKEKGEAQDLSITVPTTGSTIFTLSKGVGKELSDYIELITDKYDGFVSLRKQNLEDRIDELDEKIYDMGAKVESYRQKLINEFAALEQSLASLQSQSGFMQSSLG